jgi:hypothetical protein
MKNFKDIHPIKRYSSTVASSGQSGQSNGHSSGNWLKLCTETIQKHDYSNYLVSLLQPDAASRQAFTVLRAFNTETALVGQVEGKAGDMPQKMRMQFWKDLVDSSFNGKPVRGVAVSEGLCRMLDSGVRWNKSWFTRIINERVSLVNWLLTPSRKILAWNNIPISHSWKRTQKMFIPHSSISNWKRSFLFRETWMLDRVQRHTWMLITLPVTWERQLDSVQPFDRYHIKLEVENCKEYPQISQQIIS